MRERSEWRRSAQTRHGDARSLVCTHRDGDVYAAAFLDGHVAYAAGPLPEDDPLDPTALPDYVYDDEIGYHLAQMYADGAAAKIETPLVVSN